MAFDSEYAYRRCLEIMDEIEADATDSRGSRALVLYGVWKRHRKYVEAFMYISLFDQPARGLTLDEGIRNLLQPLANVPLFPVSPAPSHVRRAATVRQQGEVSLREIHAADVAPMRNDAIDLDEGGGFPFVL